MTTIAYDGKTLAVDSQVTGKFRKWYWNKLRKWSKGVFCCAGDLEDYNEYEARLEGGKGRPSKGSVCIYTEGKNVYMMLSGGFITEVAVPWADGSGSEYALGAMAAGKTAKEAIEIACKYSPDTGGTINTHKVR